MQHSLTKFRRFARQAGQGMTEYIIIVAVIAIGSIAVYSYFGDVLRDQTAAAAVALAGGNGEEQSKAAEQRAGEAKDTKNTHKDLTTFATGKGDSGN